MMRGRLSDDGVGALFCLCLTLFPALACAPLGASPAYPLYPNAGTRLGPEKVARLSGPIASVDGEKVGTKGNTFELLPGCHVVTMQSNVGESSSSGGWEATFGKVVFAFEMRPAHTYSIDVEKSQLTGPVGEVAVRARERTPTGGTMLVPLARSQADIDECRRWANAEGF